MAFRRTAYTFPAWVNVNDPNAPPVGAQPLDAAALTRIETGVKDALESLQRVSYELNLDEFSANAPVDSFPAACVSYMRVSGGTWLDNGVVFTHRVRASVATDADAQYEFQVFKAQSSHEVSVRYALSGGKTVWTPNTAVSVGAIRQPITPNGYYYQVQSVTGTGTTGSSQPNFASANDVGETVTDNAGANQVVWVYLGSHWSSWEMDWNGGNDGAGSGLNADLLDDKQGADYTNSVPPNFLSSGFIVTGLVATADGSSLSQLNLTGGEAFVKQPDGSFRRRAVSSNSVTVATPSTTYYLDLNPDGSLSFATSHSGNADYLPLATVTTNASTEVATVTDTRNTYLSVGDIRQSGKLATLPSTTQTLLAATRITNNAHRKYIDSSGAIILSATPTIEAGVAGQVMKVRNIGANNITLQNDSGGGLVGSKLRLAANNVVLQPLNSIELEWVAGTTNQWIQNTPTTNLA